MNDTISRKYVFILAAVAAAVLTAGAFLRPKKVVPEPPSPSEMASLQSRVRREELRGTASYFAERAQALAQHVVYSREHESSAVAWEKAGQVLTTRAAGAESFEPPLVLFNGDTEKPPSPRLTDLDAGRWVLIIGRSADGQLLWTPALYGGARQATCAGENFRELIVNARLDSALAGAGAFDLDGVPVGIVANCDGTYHLISAASISPLLKAFQTSERRIEAPYGFHVTELSANSKRFFSLDSGLLVTEVTQGDAADQAGLKAGDVITVAKGQTLSQRQELWNALEEKDENACALEVFRNRRKLAVRMPSLAEARHTKMADASLGIRILRSTPVAESVYVAPGTPSYRAGLRTGDHLIQIGEKRSSSAAELSRAISAMGDKPLLIVYQRSRAQRAALVAK